MIFRRSCVLIAIALFLFQVLFAFLIRWHYTQSQTAAAAMSSGLPAIPRAGLRPISIPAAAPIASGGGGGIASDDEAVASYLMSKLRSVSWQLKHSVLQIGHAYGQQVLSAGGGKSAPVPPAFHSPPPTAIVASHAHCATASRRPTLSVATYNLWNLNGDWPSRRTRIVALLSTLAADVIGVQESRVDPATATPQITQLQQLLSTATPPVKYEVVSKVVSSEAASRGGDESIGLLSRHPILSSTSKVISSAGTPNRVVLQAEIRHPQIGSVNVFVTHLSYVDVEQCHQLVRLQQFMAEFDANIPQIVTGDFNSYLDWEWGIDMFTQRLPPQLWFSKWNGCAPVFESYRKQNTFPPLATPSFFARDVWELLHPTGTTPPPAPVSVTAAGSATPASLFGITFPTFSDHRIQDPTRPDRILIAGDTRAAANKHLLACEVSTFGDCSPPADTAPVVYPSDHRGVFATLVFDDRADAAYSFDRKMAALRNALAGGGVDAILEAPANNS